MIKPEIADLLNMVDNRFTLCSIVSKRARQLNDDARKAERAAKDALADNNGLAVTFAHDKPVPTAVYELYEGELKYDLASQD